MVAGSSPGDRVAPGLALAFALGATAFGTGNLAAPLHPSAVTVGQGLLVLAAAWGAVDPDPLRLGPKGRLLPVLLLATFVLSTLTSPTPRAGRPLLVFLPLFLLLVSAMARGLRTEAARGAVALVVGVVAGRGLLDRLAGDSERVAGPLGHHNVLAGWLVLLLPVAILAATRGSRVRRTVLGVGSAAGVVALLGTGSLAGLLGGGVASVVAVPGLRRKAVLAVGGTATALVAGGSRWLDVLAGRDSSVLARGAYLEAAGGLFRDRWLFGVGPGAFPWTAGVGMRPVPGVSPAAEIVGVPHSLPARILAETGLVGALVVVATLAAWTVARSRRPVADPALHRAGSAGLAGGSVFSFAGMDEGLPATWWAVAAVAGVVLAAEASSTGAADVPSRGRPGRRIAVALVLLLPVVVAGPLRVAAHADARAASRESPVSALRDLERAVRFDPAFPLYRFRRALELERAGRPEAARREATVAAETAPGIAAFAILAGRLTGDPAALGRACDLAPFSPVVPVLLARADPASAEERLARALLADPRMLATTELGQELARRAVARAASTPDVPELWAAELRRTLAALPPRGDLLSALVLEVDREAATSLSLVAFRRRPSARELARVEVDAGRAAGITLPGAISLPGASRDLLASPDCRLPRDLG